MYVDRDICGHFGPRVLVSLYFRRLGAPKFTVHSQYGLFVAPKKRPALSGAQREGRRARLQRLEGKTEASRL